MSAGGTERWLQEMAIELTKRGYPIDFFYCDSAPYKGSNYKHARTDLTRLNYLKDNKVNLIEFKVGHKDISTPKHEWLDTNFWQVFNQENYLFVQSAIAGASEYPFSELKIPVIDFVSLSGNINRNNNVAWTIHLSEWQRHQWLRLGGRYKQSSVIPIPAFPRVTNSDLRQLLGIQSNTLVLGFHQRNDENIFSDIPLKAYKKIESESTHFILLGGSYLHREQASQLGIRNITFLDHESSSEAISQFLNTLDVFTHGRSDGETFGSVIAEAMIHGVPVISHQVRSGANAHRDTIGPGGFFAKSISEYIDYLNRYIADSQLRVQMGANGLSFATKHYTLKSAADKLVQIYSNVFPAEFRANVDVKYLTGNHSKTYILKNYMIAFIGRVKHKLIFQIKNMGNSRLSSKN